jgi:hypothetical protein
VWPWASWAGLSILAGLSMAEVAVGSAYMALGWAWLYWPWVVLGCLWASHGRYMGSTGLFMRRAGHRLAMVWDVLSIYCAVLAIGWTRVCRADHGLIG